MPDTILVYRDRIAPRSEVQFLRRMYVGFKNLEPHWIGCKKDKGRDLLGAPTHFLGKNKLQKFLFQQFGIIPKHPNIAAMAPKLIHAQFGKGGALALPLARKFGIPLVVTFHGGDASKETHYRKRLIPSIYQRRMKALIDESAQILAVSEHIKRLLVQRGFPAEKILVHYMGVELDTPIEPIQDRSEEPALVFAGRFVEKKGLPYLLEALKILGSEAPPCLLIGDGPLLPQVHEAAKELPKLRLLGWQTGEATRARMNGALAVVVPSVTAKGGDSEGLPSVVFEAMAAGTPVIGSRNAGIAEAVQDEVTGLLVEAGNAADLAKAIARLKNDPALRARLGSEGKASVARSFDAKIQSQKLEQLFLDIIARSNKA